MKNIKIQVYPFLFFIVFTIGHFNIVNAQYLLKTGGTSNAYESGTGNTLKIGLGTTSPVAKFHVKSDYISQPAFFAEGTSSGVVRGSVRNLYYTGNRLYGIFQYGIDTLFNYFQNNLGIGQLPESGIALSVHGKVMITEGLILRSTGIFYPMPVINSQNALSFNIESSEKGSISNIMYLRSESVTIRGKLKTDAFQMVSDEAGDGKVLVSDENGNGNWGDPSKIFDDGDWLYNFDGDLYANTTVSKVGIGTTKPSEALEICHHDLAGGILINQMDTSMKKSEIKFCVHNTPRWSAGNDITGNRLNSFFIYNHNHVDGQGHTEGKTEFFIADNGMTGIGTLWPRATLDVEGSFTSMRAGIGTDPPALSDSTWKLFVEGGIKAREIKVTIQSFSDYVFDDDYSLMNIYDLETYVQNNHHLPGIPSAGEVDKDGGVELGSMQTKLLEKIEEQSLYIISLQKQIDELKSMIIANQEGK